ncbi:diaminopimelate epimerase [Fodinibius salsisoli]|uniref:Diaminopimelate epimerase n=1 Tax=Fodinibius salsisoli TaxID=2820877 RepID=A0ABT3PL88_9BACT|nr:diaminopimelate epimerase [Fodinibius salsisoli]MCW9706662.1 diaminopimelate epimerase [Fodinibius salsisoli]
MDNKTNIPFTKMQGAGNDFVVIDNRKGHFSKQELIAKTPNLCDRRFGIGADGLLVLLPAEHNQADYTMFYRNADGSDAGMCGNGARCLSLFAHEAGFPREHIFNVHDVLYEASIQDKNSVQISFPVKTSIEEVTIEGQQILVLHTGTEHIVLQSDAEHLEKEDRLCEQGSELRYHSHFEPKGTNVNFINGKDETTVQLQTYERGVEDLTLACGTGAIASALAWHYWQNEMDTDYSFDVLTKGGKLQVDFSFDPQTKTYSNLKLEGPAHFVFKGSYPG